MINPCTTMAGAVRCDDEGNDQFSHNDGGGWV